MSTSASSTCKSNVEELYQMINTGQMLDAFEKFYADDVVMIEATGEVRKGKDISREFEKKFLAGIKEIHGGGTPYIAANEDAGVTFVETWMDVTFQDGNRVKMEQIARQKWDGDKIVEERFYYNAAGMM
ncbi:SnoaL-like domain-containing protein [Pontibacter sp. G13]|uniref:nuclear transport factor 2 family protein n=1 Tax=Pontibacter sp. G13 TaxID=3074898 RepID=UPI0028891767|nr:SnoaL-like domain-containing protein [Pontibacter sp. G13]WNJ21477.1 ester cyclase [Pontibacter sp. G13]